MTDTNHLAHKDLRSNNFRENRTKRKRRLLAEKRAVGRPKKVGLGWCYVPENFSEEDKAKFGDLLESGICVFQLLHLFRVIKGQPKDAWVDLSYDYCNERILHWSKTIRLLLETNILERTKVITDPYGFGIVVPRGEKGGQAYGYRFHDEKYREATFRKVQITNPKILARLQKATNIRYPVQRWLIRNLEQVEIDDVPERCCRAAARRSFTRIGGRGRSRAGSLPTASRFGGFGTSRGGTSSTLSNRRMYSNVANLTRELRAYLRVGGSPLVEIDIKNSQPLFIGLVAKAAGVRL